MIDWLVSSGRPADLGHGLKVQRLLPTAACRSVGPFVFLDHAGPVRFDAGVAREADVRPHPHIGLCTLSYLFSGAIMHRDSLGSEQLIRPGDVNWMQAGRGISHSERFEDASVSEGAGLELLQCWVGLPDADEEIAPDFSSHSVGCLPLFQDTGCWGRLVAGEADGLRSPVPTRSPLFLVHAMVAAGHSHPIPGGHAERAVHVVRGRIEVEGHRVQAGQLLIIPHARPISLRAEEDAVLVLLGGEPLGPRFVWWNFMSSRKERIEQAKADWLAGRIPLPEHDNKEFIPLPGH